MTVAELLRATREFYTKRKRRWSGGALYDGVGYCVLGAMSAVCTNEEYLKTHPGLVRPGTGFKGFDLISLGALALRDALELGKRGKWQPVYEWNDEASREEVIAGLRKAEEWAKERGL